MVQGNLFFLEDPQSPVERGKDERELCADITSLDASCLLRGWRRRGAALYFGATDTLTLCMLEDIIYTLTCYVSVIMFVYAQFDCVDVSRKCQYMHEMK